MPIRLRRTLDSFLRDHRGNVAVVAAVCMPVVLGSLGMGAEVASWYAGKRNLQSAADSAAIAAATNSGDDYAAEARAVARQYGLEHGVDNVTVDVTNTAACPGGGNDCFRVTIRRVQPLLLAQAVGFMGDTTIGGQPAKTISATSLAEQGLAPREYCVLALAGSGDPEALRSNGAPKADLTGCNVASNSNATCNGHNLGAEFGDAVGTNSGCGKKRNSNIPRISDPYTNRVPNIPADPCKGEYHWFPETKKDPPLPSENTLHGPRTETFIPICGDGQLIGPTLLQAGSNVLIVVYGGSLDLGSYTLQTQPGTKATIVFTGPQVDSHKHIPMGSGKFDIQAPTNGPWRGIAIYQNPALASAYVGITEAGNSPTWDITGLVYMPKASVTFSGAVNKSSNGASCFVLVVDNVVINGTGGILSRGECKAAGLMMPVSQVPSRGKLVS